MVSAYSTIDAAVQLISSNVLVYFNAIALKIVQCISFTLTRTTFVSKQVTSNGNMERDKSSSATGARATDTETSQIK